MTVNRRHKEQLDRARARGLLPPDELAKVTPGSVFLVKDEAIHHPTHRLPSAGPPKKHKAQWAVVVQAFAYNREEQPKSVLVVPCSGSGAPDKGDFAMPQSELTHADCPFDEPAVTAYTTLLQPCLKSDLLKPMGALQPATWGALRAQIAKLLDLQVPVLAPTPATTLAMPPRPPAPPKPPDGS